MAITPIPSGSQTTQTSATPKDQNLGKDAFLKLLVTQLSNQNPLNPMDNTEFVAQMAQFTSLEQMTQISSGITKLTELQGSSAAAQAAGFIGKKVTVESDLVNVSTNGGADFAFDLPAATTQTRISITDANGQEVRSLVPGALSKGVQTLSWDGKDSSGALLPNGNYRFSVQGTDAAGNTVTGSSRYKAVVTGISVDTGTTELLIGSAHVGLDKVRMVEVN